MSLIRHRYTGEWINEDDGLSPPTQNELWEIEKAKYQHFERHHKDHEIYMNFGELICKTCDKNGGK